MNRTEKIRLFINDWYLAHPDPGPGITAMEVANGLSIWRNDASKELNQMVKEGYLKRTATRPVYFQLADAQSRQQEQPAIVNAKLTEKYVLGIPNDLAARDDREALPENLLTPAAVPEEHTEDILCSNLIYDQNDGQIRLGQEEAADAFAGCIGHNGSLQLQIEAAKAATVYPRHGLHTLIIGETGVGKTMLAKCMHQNMKLALQDPGIPFISFNCAEYADNPQLLLAQLFGYEKGAFTGANTTKDGLISKANGGILFLDEIHRLSPVGQEMFFSVIDHGVYRRLGGYTTHPANLMIIGATTENISSVLLTTFNRRFPMKIQIPSMDRRPLCERLDMILIFFMQEISRCSVPVVIPAVVIKLLLGYKGNANIGHLKNTIQICCARGYYRYLSSRGSGGQDSIEISLDDISREIYSSYTFPEQINRYCNRLLTQQCIRIRPGDTMEDLMQYMDQEMYHQNKQYAGFFQAASGKSPSKRMKDFIELQQNQSEQFINYVIGAIPTAFLNFAQQFVSDAAASLDARYAADTHYYYAYILYEIVNCASGNRTLTSEYSAGDSSYESQEYSYIAKECRRIFDTFGVQVSRSEMLLLTLTMIQNRIDKKEEVSTEAASIQILLAIRDSSTPAAASRYLNSIYNSPLVSALPIPKGTPDQKVQQEIVRHLQDGAFEKGLIILTNCPSVDERSLRETFPGKPIMVLNKYNSFLAMEIAQQAAAFRDGKGNVEDLFKSIRQISYIGDLQVPDKILPFDTKKSK